MENENCQCIENQIKEDMVQILEKYTTDRDNLIQILNETQEKFGYIPKTSQLEISKYLNIPMAEVYGVITFYSRFTLEPKGDYLISVCLGTACYVRGAQDLIDKVTELTGVAVGTTSADGKFSLEATRCIGACGLAPVLTVNEDVYGRLTVNDIPGIVEKYNG